VTENIDRHESEVEEARAKLAKDLAVLRSPQTYREFAADLKSEAQSVVQNILDDVKARAAANPTAALAIGAGIGWRLLRHPPIATALIGAGLLSLWRTRPMRVAEEEYLATAQRRFGEQLSEVAGTLGEYTADTAVAAREKVGTYARSALHSAEELTASATEQTAEMLSGVRQATADISDRAADVVQRATSRAISASSVRDQVLLGVAGAAVVAALGIAYQRRASNELPAWASSSGPSKPPATL
jgi:hypothetical protein